MKATQLASMVGVLLIVVGAAWFVVSTRDDSASVVAERPAPTSAPAATPFPAPPPPSQAPAPAASPSPLAPSLDSFEAHTLLRGDLGTGSSEFSGVALNEDTNRLLIVDDEGQLFEFDLDADGVPVTPPRRTVQIRAGGGDTEGIAWLDGNRYAVANENDGSVMFLELADDATQITADDVDRTMSAAAPERDGSGIEGVAIIRPIANDGPSGFAVVVERPAELIVVASDGSVFSQSVLTALPDASDLWVRAGRVVSVLTDEGQAIQDFGLDDGHFAPSSRLELVFESGQFVQPEGLTFSRDGTRLYVVGEAPDDSSFVFGLFTVAAG